MFWLISVYDWIKLKILLTQLKFWWPHLQWFCGNSSRAGTHTVEIKNLISIDDAWELVLENVELLCLLTVVQAKKASWNAFCKWHKGLVLRHFLTVVDCESMYYTVKRTKWMRKRIKRGWPNQKRWSPGWTSGMPFTMSPFSWIRSPSFVIITWSFVPTIRITYSLFNTFTLVKETKPNNSECLFLRVLLLTTNGMNGCQRKECNPVHKNIRANILVLGFLQEISDAETFWTLVYRLCWSGEIARRQTKSQDWRYKQWEHQTNR